MNDVDTNLNLIKIWAEEVLPRTILPEQKITDKLGVPFSCPYQYNYKNCEKCPQAELVCPIINT
jgi:hypothetical protein